MVDAVEWTDVMVDVETTGLNSHINGIIQLSAIKFNLESRKIGPVFDRMPMLLPFRQWDEDTRNFWQVKNRNVYMEIVGRQEPGPQVFLDFYEWVRSHPQPENGIRTWMKPTHFDWGFLASHMQQVDRPMPLHYRYARDLNSFMAGLTGKPDHVSVEKEVPFPEGGKEHNALHDNVWQIEQLFHALDTLR